MVILREWAENNVVGEDAINQSRWQKNQTVMMGNTKVMMTTTHLARLMILFLARDFDAPPNWRMSGRKVVDALRKIMVPG